MFRVIVALILLAISSLAQTAPQSLHSLIDHEWEYTLEHDPLRASWLGDLRYNDRLPDVSLEAAAREHAHNQQVLKELAAIPRAQLSAQDQLNYDLFERNYKSAVERYDYKLYLRPVHHMEFSIQTWGGFANNLSFRNRKDYEDWIARLRAYPRAVEQTTTVLREGLRQRILYPKVILKRVSTQLAEVTSASPDATSFYTPFTKFPDSVSAADRERLSASARQVIANDIQPALKKFQQFFEKEYFPASFDEVGTSQIPNGQAAYAFTARDHTTTNLTPEQIHQLGLSEVKRIRAEMEKVKAEVGFKGSLTELFTYLRSDPKFFYKTGDDLLTAYRALSKTIDPKLPIVIGTIPRQPYGVEPIPMQMARDTTTAYYYQGTADGKKPGTYYVNLYKPDSRPKWEMVALSIHEAVPGHHLQIARSFELGEIPKFRRYSDYTAYVEGWGLYSESLGYDMGLYKDPYDRFGQLTYDMWRAVRLVVDTGMHAKHWTRQQAIDYFKDNAAKTELDIVNEIDRYIAWPGQALAYKMGQLKMLELRKKAEQTLGPKFDIREFNDVLLGSGAVPLDTLEQIVNTWISSKQK
jgi:uncharacterized protein (DUF885 family)